ncbi:cysteine--tRNA ligase [Hirschia baltica]|uniref:Cysteine--tRNA ligase n=1 Tax=Hirschia baltica (strain ATCC 49814 / DSM 5838 / IFAM 1418) TaxID=582402 RepID=C6XNB4_HIRBI|nr:cysteine--tRNA ligase [Hirschia baltica]ACT60058.1 cysteinyl-tRNA synthetase [Hirschia baltica ATCC 49814]
MDIKLTNSLTRKKEVFIPQDEERVTMYVCGPTVYSYAHIGNFRPPVVFDILYRLLRSKYGDEAVLYASNLTDVDDKIIKASNDSGEPISAITEKFTKAYLEDSAALNILEPDFRPTAVAHIPQMIEMMKKLERKKYAYRTESGLWFHVKSMEDYGKLSGRNLDDMLAGARVDVESEKRDPADFALWKVAKPGEPEDAIWDSPWGRGRPGWHIECSAMIEAVLGKTIDIHGGGIDLQFPHHENEIAQSECAHGEIMAHYWLHNGFLDIESEKMSKSIGNVKIPHEMLKETHGEVLRMALLSAQYRQPLDWTQALLDQCKATLDRAYGALRRVWDFADIEYEDIAVIHALCDDLNTPQALAELSRISGEANRAADAGDQEAMAQARADLIFAGDMLGLLQLTPEEWEKGDDGDDAARIDLLVQARLDARANKDWAEADRIRDELAAEGIEIMDNAGGSTWRRG